MAVECMLLVKITCGVRFANLIGEKFKLLGAHIQGWQYFVEDTYGSTCICLSIFGRSHSWLDQILLKSKMLMNCLSSLVQYMGPLILLCYAHFQPIIYAWVSWVIIGADDDLLPVWCQAIIYANAGILSIRHKRTYFNDILFRILKFPFKKMHWEMLSAKWESFCLGLSVLIRMCYLVIFPLE